MNHKGKIASSLGSIGLILVLVWALMFIASTTDHVIPDNPITDPDNAIAATTMLVSPDQQEGDTQGEGQDTQQQEQDQQQNETQQSTTSQESATTSSGSTTDNGNGSSGGGNIDNTDVPSVTNSDLRIVTNLKTLTFSSKDVGSDGVISGTDGLTLDSGDALGFYVYYQNAKSGYSIRVNISNDSTAGNGQWLDSSDGKNYTATLARGTNTITVYTYKNDTRVGRNTFQITYREYDADPAKQPTVATNLDNGQNSTVTNQHFTFTVTATDYQGNPIYDNHITVQLDGNTVAKAQGTTTCEYDLHFDTPVSGDTEEHTVTVTAWDDEGHITSPPKSYTITYRYVSTGDKIGTVTVIVDATTVLQGQGIVASFTADIYQSELLSDMLKREFEARGYTIDFTGTDDNLDLTGIEGGGIANGAAIWDNLQAKIEKDDIGFTGISDSDRLQEYDFTYGSGWMYSVNGSYPQRGIANYYPNDGDTIKLLFTLAYGKDVGAQAGGQGTLSSYCGTWADGQYYEDHSFNESSEITIVSFDQDYEYCAYVCAVPGCGALSGELGQYANSDTFAREHDWKLDAHQDPTETEPGIDHYVCARDGCGATKDVSIPATGTTTTTTTTTSSTTSTTNP